MIDSIAHTQRKQFFDRMLTIYGRKPVLEALENTEIPCFRLHLAETNKPISIIQNMIRLAEHRNIEIVYHSRQTLSQISKNGKQDQGVAADLQCINHQLFDAFLENLPQQNFSLIALDGITNPQNLGMIIRSVTASPCFGIILPKKGTAAISPLVIKASAGVLFKSTLIHCDSLEQALPKLINLGINCCTLSSHSSKTLSEYKPKGSTVYVLGNESNGVSKAVEQLCSDRISIPMNNGVESLNVAVTAALLAFHQSY